MSLLAVLFAATAGCAAPLAPALDALEDGRLPAAATEFRQLEAEARGWPPRARARYALYRGLTELGLGNAVAADRFLHAAWLADRSDPRCFDEREHGALLAAWHATGRLPGEAGRRAERPEADREPR